MVKFLLSKPIAVIMVFIALTLLGLTAMLRIPVSPLPDISIPEITVHINYGKVSAQELENAIVQNLKTQLQQVPALDNMHSETRDGYSVLKLRFKYGTDIDYAFIEVNEKIDLSMNSFPRDFERPKVVKATAVDIPVFFLNLRLRDTVKSTDNASRFIELSDFASQVIKRRLEQLPEIAFCDITGVSYPEVYIIPDQASVAALNLKNEDFKRIIENNNLVYGNVSTSDGVLQYNIHFASANPASVDDIRNIRFKVNDRIFRLADVARIGMRKQDSGGGFLSHHQNALNLAVIKQPDAKLNELRLSVNKLIAELEKDYPDIIFEQTQDQTALLEFSIRNLKQDLLLGGLFAFLLMFFFLKNIRAPLLIGITIPVCLTLCILAFDLFNITINIISLSGLVLGVGLMIDNSIIVIDNIAQYDDGKLELSEACARGTNDIIRPLIASALTTCSVFLPLIFLSGISGALFYDQAMGITIGLIISLIVSVTLLPVLYKLLHQIKVSHVERDFFDRYGLTFFEKLYEAGFRWTFNHKIASVMIVIMLMTSNVFLFNKLKKEKLPSFEETQINIRVDWNSNISTQENSRRTGELIHIVNRYVVQSNEMLGKQQYLLSKEKELSASEVQIFIKSRNSGNISIIKDRISRIIRDRYPKASLTMRQPSNIFEQIFGDDEPDLVVQIRGTAGGVLPANEKVEQVRQLINDRFPEAKIGPVPAQENLILMAIPEKLLFYDVSMENLYGSLKNALNEGEIGSLQNGSQRIPIVVGGGQSYLNKILRDLVVVNAKGAPVPVSGMLIMTRERAYKMIEGDRKGNYVSLSIITDRPVEIRDFVLGKIKNDNDLNIDFKGAFFSNHALINEMAMVLLVAFLLLYFILAAQFESLIQPLIVLFELPISMSGALIMLYLFGASVNLMSLIGLIVMCGIIINDSILKIDTINQLMRKKEYVLMEAIHTAGRRRLKSIIMTAMTTILSVAPFMFGSDIGSTLQRPLSLALIGGMALGTPVSLYFIPLVYWFYYAKINKTPVTVTEC
jgi:multidrug efflux pump subunit AcrB